MLFILLIKGISKTAHIKQQLSLLWRHESHDGQLPPSVRRGEISTNVSAQQANTPRTQAVY